MDLPEPIPPVSPISNTLRVALSTPRARSDLGGIRFGGLYGLSDLFGGNCSFDLFDGLDNLFRGSGVLNDLGGFNGLSDLGCLFRGGGVLSGLSGRIGIVGCLLLGLHPPTQNTKEPPPQKKTTQKTTHTHTYKKNPICERALVRKYCERVACI